MLLLLCARFTFWVRSVSGVQAGLNTTLLLIEIDRSKFILDVWMQLLTVTGYWCRISEEESF